MSICLGAMFISSSCVPFVPIVKAQAQEKITSVNGIEISDEKREIAKTILQEVLQQIPPQQHEEYVDRYLTETEVVYGLAVEDGLDKNDLFEKRIDLMRKRLLLDMYLEKKTAEKVTDEEIKKVYENQVLAQSGNGEEVRARHVLLKTKEEAIDVMEKAKAGDDFADLAKEFSTGPSGAQGGDLGYFTAERMVKPFSDAAFAMKAGDISEPVQTQFGWHVIKVEDRRKVEPPSLESLKDQISTYLEQQARAQLLSHVLQNADIKREAAAKAE